MHGLAIVSLLGALLAQASPAPAPGPVHPHKRYVDTTHPYVGPVIPIGDPANPTLDASKGGYPRLWEPPAVSPPPGVAVTNNINVISTALFPGGVNVHFQTPYGIGGRPVVKYGKHPHELDQEATGTTHTYDRTPPCSMMDPTQCSQFFHEVRLANLEPGTTYYYSIPGGNGTAPSHILDIRTALAPGDPTEFTVAVLCDLGYTNAKGTHEHLVNAVADGAAFVWHGGDISYSDQWYFGMLPCIMDGPNKWLVCYNGSDTSLPGGKIDNPDYLVPIPEGTYPIMGGPLGGEISVVYETNWDMWQQWMNAVTKHAPYMVAVGNHEASCAQGDAGNHVSAVLDDNKEPGATKDNMTLNYWSCPETQRNFTGYQHRFWMPGYLGSGDEFVYGGSGSHAQENGKDKGKGKGEGKDKDKSGKGNGKGQGNGNGNGHGNGNGKGNAGAGQTKRNERRGPGPVGNFWYSFDYGLAHFITLNSETDYADSPEKSFIANMAEHNTTSLQREHTWVMDSGPFGYIDGSFTDNAAYEQIAWLRDDLAAVDRTQTPWIIAMSHRPLYSSQEGGYLKYMRAAFETLMLDGGVDLYISGHLHWYERLFPLAANGTIVHDAVVDNHTYRATPGVMTHIINGQAGNLESHELLADGTEVANFTALLDVEHYGFSKLTVHNATVLGWEFVRGDDGSLGDWLYITKE